MSRQDYMSTLASCRKAYEEEILKWGHRRQWEKALALFEEMAENDVDHDVPAYAAAIKACGEKVKQWQRSLVLLGELGERVPGGSTNTEAFNWAVAACARAREWSQALGVLRWMRERAAAPDETTYTMALHVCNGGAFWAEALAFLQQMEADGFAADQALFNQALDACDKAGEDRWFDWVEDRAAEQGFEIQLS